MSLNKCKWTCYPLQEGKIASLTTPAPQALIYIGVRFQQLIVEFK